MRYIPETSGARLSVLESAQALSAPRTRRTLPGLSRYLFFVFGAGPENCVVYRFLRLSRGQFTHRGNTPRYSSGSRLELSTLTIFDRLLQPRPKANPIPLYRATRIS